MIAFGLCNSDPLCQELSVPLTPIGDRIPSKWTFYPNPATNAIQISGQGWASGPYPIYILDPQGRTLFVRRELLQAGAKLSLSLPWHRACTISESRGQRD
ncbi:MAG: hypothetical protein D6722_01760 [Bacteroidetes bacterium]|nr:MAG: hypothetical protein D6722_01760 [Bacteroidota bacterium]